MTRVSTGTMKYLAKDLILSKKSNKIIWESLAFYGLTQDMIEKNILEARKEIRVEKINELLYE